jgi:hypothetical protein
MPPVKCVIRCNDCKRVIQGYRINAIHRADVHMFSSGHTMTVQDQPRPGRPPGPPYVITTPRKPV